MITSFCAAELEKLVARAGMVLPQHVVPELIAALDAGKHVVLTGPPGTGKTTLAHLTAELGARALRCTGTLGVTASSDWGAPETTGSYVDSPEGRIFRPGVFLQAIESGRWLVIDEFNRANFDRAAGPLFTILAGQAVTLPFSRAGSPRAISIVPAGVDAPPDTDALRVPEPWRVIATMNVVDRASVFSLSYALMRRFAFIEVESPSVEAMQALMAGPGGIVAALLPVRELVDIGPAVFVDGAAFAARRCQDHGVTPSRVLYETFRAFLAPHLDQLDEKAAAGLYELLTPAFDEDELVLLRRSYPPVLFAGSSRRLAGPASAGSLGATRAGRGCRRAARH